MIYKAIIRGDRVEWLGERPEGDAELEVQISVRAKDTRGTTPANHPTEPAWQQRNRKALAALRRAGDLGAFDDVADPVAWQREIRRDRPLVGRQD